MQNQDEISHVHHVFRQSRLPAPAPSATLGRSKLGTYSLTPDTDDLRVRNQKNEIRTKKIGDQNIIIIRINRLKIFNVSKPYARASFSPGLTPVLSAACPDAPGWSVLRIVLGIGNSLSVRRTSGRCCVEHPRICARNRQPYQYVAPPDALA